MLHLPLVAALPGDFHRVALCRISNAQGLQLCRIGDLHGNGLPFGDFYHSGSYPAFAGIPVGLYTQGLVKGPVQVTDTCNCCGRREGQSRRGKGQQQECQQGGEAGKGYHRFHGSHCCRICVVILFLLLFLYWVRLR